MLFFFSLSQNIKISSVSANSLSIGALALLSFLFFVSEMPQGQLPILQIDGKVTLAQSLTIARYIAREFSKNKNYVYHIQVCMRAFVDKAKHCNGHICV